MRIPKAPKVEEPAKIRRQDVKVRKTWTRNPGEQVHRDKRREQQYRPMDKGELKRQAREALDDNEECE